MRSTEIGSEFWSGCSKQSEGGIQQGMMIAFSSDYQVISTLSGRTALELIVEELVANGNKSVYMPSYCCHTMIEPFVSHGMRVKFYDIVVSDNVLHRIFHQNHGCDVVFLMDYFGFIDKQTKLIAEEQRNMGKSLIYDCTHSVFSDIDASLFDYIFGSYRKWIDVNYGFVASKSFDSSSVMIKMKESSTEDEYVMFRTKLFDAKARYIRKMNFEKAMFLPWIALAEDALERDYHYKLPDSRSIKVIANADVSDLKNRRRNNAQYLINGIKELGDDRITVAYNSIGDNEVPLFVPILVSPKLRNNLRKHLVDNEIYCPLHWPLSELHLISDIAKSVYQSELSLICDQRYDVNDMERIIRELSNFLTK